MDMLLINTCDSIPWIFKSKPKIHIEQHPTVMNAFSVDRNCASSTKLDWSKNDMKMFHHQCVGVQTVAMLLKPPKLHRLYLHRKTINKARFHLTEMIQWDRTEQMLICVDALSSWQCVLKERRSLLRVKPYVQCVFSLMVLLSRLSELYYVKRPHDNCCL